MIVAKIDPLEYGIRVDGHAGYAESGKDIVCAAVSALTQTLQEYLSNVNGFWYVDDGNIWVMECSPETDAERKQAAGAFEFVLLGLEMIANTYPDYVSVEIV